jgi:ubiquinone/menaquinone biosynthesis C-methylase UbiE
MDSSQTNVTPDPTRRFDNRVDDYRKGRPGYPAAILDELRRTAVLTHESIVADIGCGTGLSAEPFVNAGCTVYGVEPNASMRVDAETKFATKANFKSIDGMAEATGLPDRCMDWIVCAQAFHWFDPSRARSEFVRILKSGGAVALIWNERIKHGDGFSEAYEALIHRHGLDYTKVRHENIDVERITAFYGRPPNTGTVTHRQILDWEHLAARVRSSSYMPHAGPEAAVMIDDLRTMFERFQTDGRVVVSYECKIFSGALRNG